MLGHRRYRGTILETTRSLLPVAPSLREMEFLNLDGVEVTNMMAGTSAVQFTVDVTPEDAIRCLNNLGSRLPLFLEDYPQDAYWKRYMRESRAGYRADRYGGPLSFDSLRDYCDKLAVHRAVAGGKLVAHEEVPTLDIHQFIKSVWWYFRLKRYGEQLCIEIRPLARRSDSMLDEQLALALDAMAK